MKGKNNCFRELKGAFRNAKRSIINEQISIQSTGASIDTSKSEQGKRKLLIFICLILKMHDLE